MCNTLSDDSIHILMCDKTIVLSYYLDDLLISESPFNTDTLFNTTVLY